MEFKKSQKILPSNKEIEVLLNYFKNRKFNVAEKKALLMTKKFPIHPFAWKVLGSILAITGRLEQALEVNHKVVDLSLNDYEAHYNLGITFANLGLLNKAEDSFKQSVLLKPDHAESYFSLGVILDGLERLDEAEVNYKQAVILNPDHAEAYNNLGITLKKMRRLDEAKKNFQFAISVKINFFQAYNNLGNILRETGQLSEAKKNFKEAIRLKPNFTAAYNNLGITLSDLGQIDEAISKYKKAIELKPNFAEAYNNLGIALKELGKLDRAEENFKQAISIKANYAEAHFNLSYIYNLRGDFRKGLELYEWRYHEDRKEPSTRPPRKNLIWDGEKSLKDKKFLIYEEQGIGDVIQFCRYLFLIEQKGANIIFKVRSNLHHLLQTLNCKVQLLDQFTDYHTLDFECPLLSLPHLLKTEIESIPFFDSYLKADTFKILEWKKKLTSAKFKVGICWQGKKNRIDKGRSFPLSCFSTISQIPNIELISLYKGENESDLLDLDFNVTTLGKNFDNGKNAFIDTAAVIMNCNLVITSDTSIAHLAGALGKPVWCVLNYVPDWRWMLNSEDTPWYPNMKLYRQNTLNNWNYVFDKIKKDLEYFKNDFFISLKC